MKNPPKVHSAKGFCLKGVTGETRVKGYVNLHLWLQEKGGMWIEFWEEAWVLKGLKVPLLLGEDFHVNYQILTNRDPHRSSTTLMHGGLCLSILACSITPGQDWKEGEEHSELQAIIASLSLACGCQELGTLSVANMSASLVRAAARICIPAYHCSLKSQCQAPSKWGRSG